ncbi:GNAT family N-acetyltransferase [Pseudorhodobacter wandonensis]|uniref:GNAT family N-acetyltransferase n=1 Tax=Pseudorhodobacter wandonensis TaxID=1120568 RepID=UPI00067E5F65|nr:GNAT family N-acetyltransferase [Pseudorhodobacter wandonensis]
MTPEALATLHGQAFTTPRPWSAAEFSGLLDMAGVLLISQPAGFILGRAIAGEAEVLTLAVAPYARRQGIARQLMLEFELQAAQHNAETAFLEVAEDNAGAIGLYLSLGYVISGRRRGYFKTPDNKRLDALILTKTLLPNA